MSTYVLVHGAWHGAWCWNHLVPMLRSAGHRVIAPDLPGHGSDRAALRTVKAGEYEDAICQVLADVSEPVILVGHSMGGTVISGVAERMPQQISQLVYISGFLLVNGQCINDMEPWMGDSLAASNMSLSRDRSFLTLPEDIARRALYHDCNEADCSEAMTRLQPQPLLPFITPVTVTRERFGSVPRFYIECLQDRAVPPGCQQVMYASTKCEQIFRLDCGHSPFFSRYNELSEILLAIPAN
jgi:pimeloyl-ACP methyl ester carboxylesterase